MADGTGTGAATAGRGGAARGAGAGAARQAPAGVPLAVWALLVALSLLWGGSFLFVGIAVQALPPLTTAALRVGVAAAALWLLVALTARAMPARPAIWGALLCMGLVNNAIPFALIAHGQTQIAGGLAAILNATTPVFTVLVAHVATADERLSAARAAGVGLGLAGVAVAIGWDALAAAQATLAAQFAVLAAAVSYALAGVYGRRFRRMGLDPVATATGQVTASTLLLAPLALALERPWVLPAPGAPTWLAVLGLGLLSTALAYVLYFRILAAAGATVLLLVTVLIPPSAILLGWAVLGERLEARHGAGFALIALGLAAIDGRLAHAARTWLARRRLRAGPRAGRRPGA